MSLFFMYFAYLQLKTDAFIFYIPYVFIFMPYLPALHQSIFCFSNEEEEKIFIMKDNIRFVAAPTCIEYLTE